MGILVSPGVEVTVTDESFYASAGLGTVPLILIATAANKTSPSGIGIAPLTLASEANKLKLMTSQRELIQGYGNPLFYSYQGTTLHGFELNEYGLHAAYQYLGANNRAYVVRADIDLDQLRSSATAPRGAARAGTYWLDLSTTSWGLFQSNGASVPGSAWRSKGVLLPTLAQVTLQSNVYTPRSDYGVNGDFAVVTSTTANLAFEKLGGAWLQIGSAAWKAARPTVVRGSSSPSAVTAGHTININGTVVTMIAPGTVASVVSAIASANIANITASVDGTALVLTNTIGGDITIANGTGTALTALGLTAGVHRGPRVFYTNDASYPTGSNVGDVWFKGTAANGGTSMALKRYDAVTGVWVSITVPVYPTDLTLADGDAGKDAAFRATFGANNPPVGTVYFAYDAATGMRELRRFAAGIFETLVYEAAATEPTTAPEDGTLWFNSAIFTDVMVGDGQNWVGYRNMYPNTDPAGVIVSGSPPTTQSDGTALVDQDLWLDSSDPENYPALYRWDAGAMRWRLIDKTDQTTPFGIVFADARQDSGVSYTGIPNGGTYAYNSTARADLLASNFVDPDAPAAEAYPAGMLLFNTRLGTMNVKVWRPRYFQDGGFDPNTDFTQTTYERGDYTFPALSSTGRWVNASGNRTDGAMHAGRKAQRIMIVRALAATIATNEDLRSEILYYNLIAAPGYPELMDEMVTLNTDQKEVAFIVADTPARLRPLSADIEAWAKNARNAASNGEEGLTTANPYVGLYYPWGLATNTDGTEIMVPPSTIALRTMAYNDSVSYPWFAPAGFQRGIVTNVATVGYLTDEGEFNPVVLSPGQRDTLYVNKINPIAFIPGRGLVVYGQKTLHSNTSALDRVNVARLINYLRYQLDVLAKPFLFEQNDEQTRDAARLVMERFLAGLVGLRALEDFVVVCDETNNTPERRDRNELWIDIAIKPIKAVEFIYIPVRVVNSSTALS